MRANHLYIHVPFCARRCVYCDFSIAVRSTVPVGAYVDALAREWSIRHESSAFSLSTLYLGGGTPSKLGAEGVARVLDLVRSRATFQPDAELTLEANPEDVSPLTAVAWKEAGINRVSLGIQSFDEATLRWMHRTHDIQQAHSAIHVLREAGLDNLSIDLIFAAPGSLNRSWDRDLEQALALNVPHISMYGLTVEPHTPLGRWVSRADVNEAPEDHFEQEFLSGHHALVAHGYEHYEVSNYGLRGKHSRHNWSYWERQPYGGLGPSAHEFDGAVRRWNVAPYTEWTRRAQDCQTTEAGAEGLSADQVRAEEIYLGLRTNRGIRVFPEEIHQVRPWQDSGWATLGQDTILRLTPLGWLRLDALASSLTSLRSRY